MERLARDTRLLLSGSALFFAALAVLAGFFVHGQARTARILFEYEADRVSAGLLDAFRAEGALDASSVDPRVRAFGVYAPGGGLVASLGTPPAELPGGQPAAGFRDDRGRGVVTLVRPVGMAPGPGAMMRGMQAGRGGVAGGRGGGAVFLAFDASGFFRAERAYTAGTVLAPLLVAGLAAGFLLLVASNARYRRRDEERERLAQLGESARALAHEIRNPLGAIRMQTGLLRKAGGPALDGARELDVIDEEVERLNVLSRRAGELLRSPAGTPRPVELAAFLRDLARRSPYPVAIARDLPRVSASFDPDLLRSVVENLTRNAAESCEAPAGACPVEVVLDRGDGHAVIAVLDRGKGIPAELAEKVFDPFFTDKVRGSGVGLALSRRFVEAAGGTLTLAPREGGGTVARVTLPALEDA